MLPRVAAVGFFNASPLVEGLDVLTNLSLRLAPPSRIAPLLDDGSADLALASIADLPRAAQALTLVPVGMIASDGPTSTVRLYSRGPLSEIDTLHADTDSHTSVVLAQLVLRHLHGVSPRVAPLAPAPGSTLPSRVGPRDAVLLIGDKVVATPPDPSAVPHSLDLGEAWRAWTGLPMVYAMWMCRSSSEGDERVRLGADLLDRQRRHNATRLGWIARARGVAAGWPLELAEEYITRVLTYAPDARARAGVERFLVEAHAKGLLPAASLRWFAP